MPKFMKKFRKQFAVYWEPRTASDNFGNPTFENAVEIKCRWQSATKEEFGTLDPQLKYSDIVNADRPLKVGGKLVKGKLEDLKLNKRNVPPANAKRIQSVGEIPDINAKEIWYVAGL